MLVARMAPVVVKIALLQSLCEQLYNATNFPSPRVNANSLALIPDLEEM